MQQVLGIALTDTFGTPTFLRAFAKRVPQFAVPGPGAASTRSTTGTNPGETSATTISPSEKGHSANNASSSTNPPIRAAAEDSKQDASSDEATFASVFTGTRQDSGDPKEFIKLMRAFYDSQGIKDRKTIVFSDSLNADRCIEYKEAAEREGFNASFGVGTNFTS